MNIRTLLATALIVATGLAHSYTMRAGVSSTNSMNYYEYPVDGAAFTYSGEYVPSALASRVGFQIRILSDHNLINGKLKKPIIVPEGFDVDWNTSSATSFDDLEKVLTRVADINSLGNTGQTSLVRALYDEGYEIVLVLFKNPTAAIDENSWAIQGLTLKLAGWLEDPKLPIKYVGPSMAGLIERHALQTFRIRFSGILPNISEFISFDSPHRGAIVPMSAQAMLMFHSFHNADNTQKYRNLTSTAAKQMLLYHEQRGSYNWDVGSATTTVNGYEASSTPHGQFMQAMDNGFEELLNYSRYSHTAGDIARVAILNGSGEGSHQNLPWDSYITVLKATSGDEIGRDDLLTHGSANNQVFRGYIDSWGTEDDQDDFTYYLKGSPGYVEGAPGGTRNTWAEIAWQYETIEPDYADTFVDYWNPAFGPYPGDPGVKPVVTGSTAQGHAFVPTASALGIVPAKEGTNVNDGAFWYRNARALVNSNNYENVSIFKRAYMPVKNQPHMFITTESKNWFLGELRANPSVALPPITLPLL